MQKERQQSVAEFKVITLSYPFKLVEAPAESFTCILVETRSLGNG